MDSYNKYDKDNPTSLLDFLGKEDNIEYDVTPDKLENIITDDKIASLIKNNLTDRQKLILYLAYVTELKDVEIARKLGITQQVVSKTRNKALLNIRKELLQIKH